MSKDLVEFPTTEGATLVVEVRDDDPGMVRVGATRDAPVKAAKTLEEAIADIQPAIGVILGRLRDSVESPDEITLDFGLKLTVKAGAVIAGVEGEGHFAVSLKWTRP